MEKMLSLKEAAEILGYSPPGLWEVVRRSKLKAEGHSVEGATIRFAQNGKQGAIRFKPKWLEEFVDQITVNPDVYSIVTPKRRRPKKATTDTGLVTDFSYF